MSATSGVNKVFFFYNRNCKNLLFTLRRIVYKGWLTKRFTMAQQLVSFQVLVDILFSDDNNELFRHIRRKLINERRRNRYLMLYMIQSFIIKAIPERKLWAQVRSTDWWDKIVINSYNDSDFKDNFRVSRTTFLFLCSKMKPILQKHSKRKTITVEKRVAIALLKLGSSCELQKVASLMGVAKCTTCVITNEVCLALCNSFLIQFPSGDALQMVAEGFVAKGGLPGCCGALDGSYIQIKAPLVNPKDFYCRKQCYAIVLQAVVDSTTRFTNINVGWPGSVHDARVFRNSKLRTAGAAGNLFRPATILIQNQPVRPFLVADQAYPSLTWLKRPYGRALNADRRAFNKKLSKGRICVEHAFGQLKGRWRHLLKKNDTSLENLKLHVKACCILHNMCKNEEDEFIEEWYVEDDE